MGFFLMPKLSDTMEEGTVLQWLKAEGDQVARGEQIVEIETDKANMMVEAPEGGILSIIAAEGQSLPVGAPIAAIGEAGAVAEAPPPPPAAEEETTNIPVGDDGTGREIGMEIAPEAPTVEEPSAAPEEGAWAEPSVPAPVEPPAAAPPTPAPVVPAGDGGRVKSSPLARRLAAELGIDLQTVRGSGPEGRIVRSDVEAAARGEGAARRAEAPAPPAPAPAAAAAPRPAAPPPPAPGAVAPGERIPLTRLQKTIARRMVESTTHAPHFYLQRDIDVTDAIALRRTLVDAAPEGEGPSLNDLIVRAVAMAAAERPDAMAQFDGDAVVIPSAVHVGVAVAVERGLLVPVVRDAATKGVAQIAAEVRDLVRRCRDGSITAAELEGSTISVSNLGMFGVDRFSAVVNPPEAAILAVGRAAQRPVVLDGAIVARDVMTLTLSVDHRALYGAEAATFLGRVAELLERPGALVL
jgi:pyruvate dehydrogenase E2 component (dihydrolipoamide acetyltransferase)